MSDYTKKLYEMVEAYNSPPVLRTNVTKRKGILSLFENGRNWFAGASQYYYPDREKPRIAVGDIEKYAQYVGFDIVTDVGGKIIPVPKNISNIQEFSTFTDLWRSIQYSASPITENRNIRFRSYDRINCVSSI